MTAKKTQCPFCESIFAVTPEQLSARGGHVRCGKCFQVFKADDHLVLPTPLGHSTASVEQVASADIFNLLDQASPSEQESDTLAGQPALPVALDTAPLAAPSSIPSPNRSSAADLGKLEQKTDLEPEFDALFAALTPQSIDPNESYAHTHSAQSKHIELILDAPPIESAREPSDQLLTPLPQSAPQAAAVMKELPNFSQQETPIQDTPLPGSIPAVVLPSLNNDPVALKTNTSVFNKKQSSAKLRSLKLDDELSELFLGDNAPVKQDPLKQHHTALVDKLSSTADESWADALLKEEEDAKKAAAEQQANELLGVKKPPSVLKPSSATPTARQPNAPQSSDQSTHRSVALEEDDLLSYLSQVGAASEKSEETGTARKTRKNNHTQSLPPPASHRVRIPAKPQQATARYVAWGGLCAVMLLLLIAQWFYFNFNTLVTDSRYNRPISSLCAILGCEIPSMDLNQLSTARIKLQRSPTHRNMTQVTLSLNNKANTSQLLPKLKFMQLEQDRVIGYQLIPPEDYLQAGYRQLQQIPPHQTLSLIFELNVPRADIKNHDIVLVY